MPQATGETSSPPSDVTQSAIRSASSAPLEAITSPSSFTWKRTPVDVSAWTTPTSLVSGCFASASAT